MEKQCLVVLIFAVLATSVQGTNNATALDRGWFSFVSLTSTNVTLKCPSYGNGVAMWGTDIERRALDYDEVFAIPIDREIIFSDRRHIWAFYTPVVLKNQQMGFQVANLIDNRRRGYTAGVWYVALKDPPIKAGEDDVEMILKNGEWTKFEKHQPLTIPKKVLPFFSEGGVFSPSQLENGEAVSPPQVKKGGATASPPSREETETPVNAVKATQSEGQADGQTHVAEVERNKPNNLWLYVGIPLGFICVLLYFLRGKLKTGN